MKVKHYKTPVRLAGVLLLALSASMPAFADYQSTILTGQPVGYWRLNETVQPQPASAPASLGLVQNLNGAYNGFPTRGLPGPFAGSVSVGFDGAAASVTTPWQGALNPQTFSVELWVKPSVVPKFAYVASSIVMAAPRSGWYLAQDDGSTFGAGSAFVVRMFNQNAAVQTVQLAAPVTSTDWHHLVLTYDGTTAALYSNGALATNAPAAYVPNVSAPFSLGIRSDNGFPWPGQVAEAALYGSALSAAQVANHYTTATTTPAGYAAAVQANSPLLYYRFQEPIDPPAANLGSLGSAAAGLYIHPAVAGATGPSAPPYTGFEAANKAPSFNGAGGVVRIPNLNLRTNTVTISGWVKATGNQPVGTGLVLCHSGTTFSGLTIDQNFSGLGLGYIWAGNHYSWSPSADFGFPTLPDGDWAFVALAIEPTQAALFMGDRNNFANFAGITNSFNVNHVVEAFDGATLLAADAAVTTKNFTGSIDEVAIFNRTLSAGELYTQYASAVGGVPPKIFADLLGPTEPVSEGDPIVLTVDAGGTPPLTFTWKKGGTTVATTTNGVLTIVSAAPSDAGTYEVSIANASGSVSGQQQVVVSTVPPTAPIIVQLEGFNNRTLYPKATLKLAVSASGGGLKYQWYKNSSALASASSSAYIVPSITNSHAGTYFVTVSNSLGSVTSAPVVITVPTLVANSYESLIVSHSPQAWWRLEEPVGSTNLVDGMGRHDGYYVSLNGSVPPVTLGAPGAIAGSASTAATFSPAKQGVGVVPYSPAINPKIFTIEAWVKTPVTTSGYVPLSTTYANAGATTGWFYEINGGFWNGNGHNVQDYGLDEAAVAPNTWTHLVLQYGDTGNPDFLYRYYVNGERDDGYIWADTGLNTAGPLVIGGQGVDANTIATKFFEGQVDEVAIYPRILNQTEIRNHFQTRFGTVTVPYFVGGFLPQTVPTGSTISYNTIVQGSQPITLQWYKDNAPLTGATTTSLTIANAQVSDSGTYTLWATNGAGTASQSAQVAVIAPVGYANVTNDLVLHLRFDGNASDTSGRGNNGTALGEGTQATGPAFVPGIIGGQALQYTTSTDLTGTNWTGSSYVDLGKPADLQFGATASFTIGLWVKLPVNFNGGDLPFIGIATNSMNNPGWALGPTYGGGGWQWCLNDGVNNIDVNGAPGSLTNGGWHNFVLSVDRTAKVANAYLDGVLMRSTDITTLGNIDNGSYWPVTIGQDPTHHYPEAGTATVDDIGVWRRALTPLQVAQIYSAGSTAGRSFDTVNTNPDVIITTTRSGSSLTLNWSQGTLEQSDTLGAGAVWTSVTGASAPSYTVTPGTGSKFYRVKVQ